MQNLNKFTFDTYRLLGFLKISLEATKEKVLVSDLRQQVGRKGLD